MTNAKKQLKLPKMFRKRTIPHHEESDTLQEEIQQLQQRLREKQNELFALQRNSYKCKIKVPKKKDVPFVRPEKIILTNAKETLKNELQLMSMLTGVEVQSYILGEHCCVVFHMQHDTEHVVKHGLRIDMKNGQNVISKSSLPPGFNINAVMEDFDNIMKPDCLSSIHRALVAYYDRLDQFGALKRVLNIEAQMFKTMDGSHMEITFTVYNDTDPEVEEIELVLMLDYRIYDIRPKQYSFKEIDLPEGAADILKAQCAVFKKKPLMKAFKEAFMANAGSYRLSRQLNDPEIQQVFRPNKQNPNNDDTFRPEDCSDQSDEVDDN